MKRIITLISILTLLGGGCLSSVSQKTENTDRLLDEAESRDLIVDADVVLPLDGNVIGYEPRYKRFGEFFDDRFHGYHTGEDAEVPPEDLAPGENQLVPVRAVADGLVVYLSDVDGYGGVIILQHELEDESIQTLYGHVDLGSTTLKTGDRVEKGQFLVNLGADKSKETDGERQHLHFAVYPGTEVQLQGYVNSPAELSAWMNPYDFFLAYGALDSELIIPNPEEWGSTDNLGIFGWPWDPIPRSRSSFAKLVFSIPGDWDVEYIPSIDSLNLYTVSGEGSARERSQILIRYFDANRFLTLSTVEVLSTEELVVGTKEYDAQRYEIEKKKSVADFADQPLWRNEKHTVTDFRVKDGFSRFFVVAANPELETSVFEQVLASIEVIE